jgi:glucose/mannose transport system substrate-binding protein
MRKPSQDWFHRFIRWGALWLTLGSAGCSVSSDASATVEVINWWRERGEAPALQRLVDGFHRKHPSQRVIKYTLGNSADAHREISNRMMAGDPPDTFQANGGWDLLFWVFHNRLDHTASKMQPLDASWESAIPKPVLDTVTVAGRVYAVPLNVHRLNTLFFNRQVFQERGIPEPSNQTLTSLDDLFTLANQLRDHPDRPIAPFSLGTKDPWTLALLLFENILVAHSGGKYYREFFKGEVDVLSAPNIQRAIDDLGRFLSYDPNAGTRTWDQTIDEVANGRAAMTIMGDWAKGYFLDGPMGDQLEVILGQMATPGTEGTFVFTTDTFGLPFGAENPDGARQFLQLVASQEGQDAFSPIKGSIPARNDPDLRAYDAMAVATIEAFRAALASGNRDNLLPATAVVAPPEFMSVVFDMLAYYAGNAPRAGLPPRPDLKGNASVVLYGLRNWSDVLRGPLNRLWEW